VGRILSCVIFTTGKGLAVVGPYRIEWRRRFPSRAWRRLGWYVVSGAGVTIAGFGLFGAEPERLESGRSNPLAFVPTGLSLLFALAATPFVLALLRRPLVTADHYALSVRPGMLRTLLLPWAGIAEITAYGVPDDAFLLVRCDRRARRLGDRPRWWDRSVLRAAVRSTRELRRPGRPIEEYDLAVRMNEFVGDPAAQLASLAAFAPRHVMVADDIVS